jgi:hypothetical protein
VAERDETSVDGSSVLRVGDWDFTAFGNVTDPDGPGASVWVSETVDLNAVLVALQLLQHEVETEIELRAMLAGDGRVDE